jgi:hypothetical protein
MSANDTLWHLVIFGWAYCPGVNLVARMVDGKMFPQPIPGLVSQILVVSALAAMIRTRPSLRIGPGDSLF